MKFKELRWIVIITFFTLSIVNIWFGLLGLVCMGLPIFQAVRGKGKLHCQSHCPRGSFFSKIVSKISLRNSIPKFLLTKAAKNTLLIVMLSLFAFSMYHSGGNPKKIAFGLFRLMGISFIVGNILGIFFKPKTWCVVCPMGYGSQLITNAKKGSKIEDDFKRKSA